MKKHLFIIVLGAALALLMSQVALAGPELQSGGRVYYVTGGDTVEGIAARFGVSVEALLRKNGIANPDLIFAGQALIVPDLGYGYGAKKPDYGYGYNEPNSYGCANYHVVKAGETLSGIALYYNTTVHALLQQNKLYNKDFVYSGQKLCVPGGRQPTGYQHYDSPAGDYYHTVAKGETLSGICDYYGVNVREVTRANNMSHATYIQPGQRLAIPGYQAKPAALPYSPVPSPKPAPAPSYKSGPPARAERPGPSYRPDASDKPGPPGKHDDSASVYLRLGRNVGYEPWGKPKLGLDDCLADWFDDSNPAQRFTAEVILTNKSRRDISGNWASSSNVIFHTMSGAQRNACMHLFDQAWLDEFERQGKRDEILKAASGSSGYASPFPGNLEPDDTVDVTFFTHLEKGDLVTKVEFAKFGICFDPNSGDRISCGGKGY